MPRKAILTGTVKHAHVAAGILCDAEGSVLIADRTRASTMSDLWEFPGGKLQAGEAPEIALCRELDEELGISVEAYEHFLQLEHEYPHLVVLIDFYLVSAWSGEPSGLEGQQIAWVSTGNLDADLLLPADVVVVDALRRHLQ